MRVRNTLTITINITTALLKESLKVSQANAGLLAIGIEISAAIVMTAIHLTSVENVERLPSVASCVGR